MRHNDECSGLLLMTQTEKADETPDEAKMALKRSGFFVGNPIQRKNPDPGDF